MGALIFNLQLSHRYEPSLTKQPWQNFGNSKSRSWESTSGRFNLDSFVFVSTFGFELYPAAIFDFALENCLSDAIL